MAGLLKNTTTGSSTTSSSTSSYGFPSSSFTHPKQPIMPNDQKAKLLAMHRDGKANAGMYVAIVLFVYFILVFLLLCRYGKRRRTTSEPGLDSITEQGRFPLLRYHVRRVVNCEGVECCYNCCLPNVCICSRRCQQIEGAGKLPAVLNLDDSGKGEKTISKFGKVDSTQVEKNRISEVSAEDKKMEVASAELKDQPSGITECHQNDDSDNDESIEED